MINLLMGKIFGTRNQRYLKSLRPMLRRCNDLGPEMEALADDQLAPRLAQYREEAQNGRRLDELLPPVFALVREASRAAYWGCATTMCSFWGAWCSTQGKIAEMKTGEGKTLVATLPVVLNALSGKGVHVVTVNDYLALPRRRVDGAVVQRPGPDHRHHRSRPVRRTAQGSLTTPTSLTAPTTNWASTTCATT